MNILFVLHDSVSAESFAGVELYTYYLAKEFKKKHNVLLFFKGGGERNGIFFKKDIYDGIPYWSVNYYLKSNYLYSYAPLFIRFKVNRIFNNLLDTFKPDVVHFQHIMCLSPDLVDIVFKRKIPIVFTLHDFWLICNRIKFLKPNLKLCQGPSKFKCVICCWNLNFIRIGPFISNKRFIPIEFFKNIFRLIYNIYMFFVRPKYTLVDYPRTRERIFTAADLFISPSRFLMEKMVKFGIPKNKILYSDNGIPSGNMNNADKKTNKTLKFGFLGSSMKSKGIEILIKAFNQINSAELEIGGKLDDSFKKLIKNERIKTRGIVRGEEKIKMFKKIDALIVPSIWYENSPLTIKEAFMAKVPVITSNIGGMLENVEHMKTGLHFKVGDSDDLREKIEFLIKNPEIISEMRKNIPDVKSIEENALELENIYEKIIKDK